MLYAHFKAKQHMKRGHEFGLFEDEWAKLNRWEQLQLDQYYERLARAHAESILNPIKKQLLDEIYAAIAEKPRNVRLLVSEALNRLGVTTENPYAINTQIVTASAKAYNSALWSKMDDPELWGWEYSTAGDERVRPEHKLLDGMRYPKNNRIWEMYAPPNGWMCRCTLIPIFTGDPTAHERPPKSFPAIPSEFRYKPVGILTTI